MSLVEIRTTREQLNTRWFWARYITPIAVANGMEPPDKLHNGWLDDPDRHWLMHPDGHVLLVITTGQEGA